MLSNSCVPNKRNLAGLNAYTQTQKNSAKEDDLKVWIGSQKGASDQARVDNGSGSYKLGPSGSGKNGGSVRASDYSKSTSLARKQKRLLEPLAKSTKNYGLFENTGEPRSSQTGEYGQQEGSSIRSNDLPAEGGVKKESGYLKMKARQEQQEQLRSQQ